MWNDEDNNPYGSSFERRDSFTSSSAAPTSPTTRECKYTRRHHASSLLQRFYGTEARTWISLRWTR